MSDFLRGLMHRLSLLEAEGNESPAVEKGELVIFTFGRLNPPTIGHERLINVVVQTAQRQGADHFVFLSRTHKPPKDPLPFDAKAAIFKRMFPQANLWEATDPLVRTPYEAMGAMVERYRNLIFVVGSDRVQDFAKMKNYAEEFGAESFRIMSAGERDPDAEGVTGMSASKARTLAAAGDFEGFAQSLPDTVSVSFKKNVYRVLRREMKV